MHSKYLRKIKLKEDRLEKLAEEDTPRGRRAKRMNARDERILRKLAR